MLWDIEMYTFGTTRFFPQLVSVRVSLCVCVCVWLYTFGTMRFFICR